ncbi:MAG: hypothetical protein AAB649_07455 [Patescibacteria group bacterium]
MFILLESVGEYSDSHTTAIAASRDRSKLEERIAFLWARQNRWRTLWGQLNANIKNIGMEISQISERPECPPCEPGPQNNVWHANRTRVKRQYEAEINAWLEKRHEESETIRELAIQKLKQDNPDVSDEEASGLNWSRCSEADYDIEEVEEL